MMLLVRTSLQFADGSHRCLDSFELSSLDRWHQVLSRTNAIESPLPHFGPHPCYGSRAQPDRSGKALLLNQCIQARFREARHSFDFGQAQENDLIEGTIAVWVLGLTHFRGWRTQKRGLRVRRRGLIQDPLGRRSI